MGAKCAPKFLRITTLLLIFVVSLVVTCCAAQLTNQTDADEDELQQLLAIDEQEEQIDHRQQRLREAEAEVLSKAQRVIVELNNDNAARVINEREYVLVLGYAPWCARSADLMPQFAEAANWLMELGSTVSMAKLDAERYREVAEKLGIKGFPTLLLFVNGSSRVYSGVLSREDIVIWVRKRTGVPVAKIDSVLEAEMFTKKYQTFVLGLFETYEGSSHNEFVRTAMTYDELQFAVATNLEVAEVLFPDIKFAGSFVGIVKSEPERYTAYDGKVLMDKLMQFLDYNKFPLITRLTEMNSARVFSSPINLQVILFANVDDFHKLVRPLEDVARKFKSMIMFIHVDIANENLAKPYLNLFGMEDAEDPVVIAFDNGVNSKYLLTSDSSPTNIEEFCSQLLRGVHSPYFKSQPVPNNIEAGVKVVVGKSFDDLVLHSPSNVLLQVYTPWCMNCDAVDKLMEKLAKQFRHVGNLIFAKIDASANEHPDLQVANFPALLFYRAGADKSNPLQLSTKSNLKQLAAIIESQLKSKDEL